MPGSTVMMTDSPAFAETGFDKKNKTINRRYANGKNKAN